MQIIRALEWERNCYDISRPGSTRAGMTHAHDECAKARTHHLIRNGTFLPTRLIDLRENSPGTVKIIHKHNLLAEPKIQAISDESEKMSMLRWVAMSYCWGSSNPEVKLTADLDLTIAIPVSRLHHTIADAIKVCRGLNIPFLWVDSLCIIQGGGSDFASEASQMDRIYGGAAFTLCIGENNSATENFLGRKDAEEYPIDKNLMVANHWVGIIPKQLHDVSEKCQLATRGWCFQEDKLSDRVLYWTPHGVFWACNTVTLAEVGEKTNTRRPRSDRQDNDWLAMVEEYTKRSFTKADDRLPALSGLARRALSYKQYDVYLAGLWHDHLPAALAWAVEGRHRFELQRGNGRHGPPSWSWASLPPAIPIQFSPFISRSSRTRSQILRYNIQPQGDDRLGAVESGWIEISAAIRPFLQPGTQKIDWPELIGGNGQPQAAYKTIIRQDSYAVNPFEGKLMYLKDFQRPIQIKCDFNAPEDLTECFCVETTSSSFLLVKRRIHQQNESFVRIGCCIRHEEAEFFVNFPTRTIRLC
jgi:hypothetical protein